MTPGSSVPVADGATEAAGASDLGPVFLGALQGLTEFLPVSSSGHLVLFQQFIEVHGDEVLFDVALHLGTLVPVLWFYRQSLWGVLRDPFVGEGAFWDREGVRLLALLLVASVPTAILGLAFEDLFESLFSRPGALVVTFAITGSLLFLTRETGEGETGVRQMKWWQAVGIGVAQGFAITPGISRSGATIAVGLFFGLKREVAVRFSFLLSVPAILGAALLKLREVEGTDLQVVQLVGGTLAAMVTGYFALVLLVRVVKQGKLAHFAWYCWFAAIVAGVIAVWRVAA
ncbi:MAG: undecaprenyl-diphosphate phosphatase [Deltaproteobacteria bacterium]|nr:undecaprenyl-diphosphate phosphatase [Deltaproteobacteria bacterium]MBW2253633.1 undecaprenyl-diphosphate phosphatase [Deltaproteobacteria bacterium]